MSSDRDPRIRPRSRNDRKEVIIHSGPSGTVDGISEKPTFNAQPLTKRFHTTISKDWTDQETLEGQRLVALQEKSELNTPLNSVQVPRQKVYRYIVCIAKFKQGFIKSNQLTG